MSYFGTTEFLLRVSAGLVSGYSHINKFGHNPDAAATGEDVWAGGGTYAFYPTTAQTMEAVSTSTDDDVGGIGALTVVVEGLDASWNEISETVIMTGQVVVALQNSYIRMNRAYAVTVGTSGMNVGDISIQETGAGDVGAFIEAEDGQTQQAIYTIPAGKTAFFMKGYVAMMNATFQGTTATFKWRVRGNNGGPYSWQTQGHIGLINIGQSSWQYEYGVPAGGIPAKSDIKIVMSEASAAHSVEGGFDLILIDNTLLS